MPRGLGQDEAATFRIDDGDLQIDVSQPKEIVWVRIPAHLDT